MSEITSYHYCFYFIDPVKSYTTGSSNNIHQVADYEREIEKYMQMSLDSTQRSVNQLDSSDKLAESTARVCFLLFFIYFCFSRVYWNNERN